MAKAKSSNASSAIQQEKQNSSAKVVSIARPVKNVWDAILCKISLEIDAELLQAKAQQSLYTELRCDYLKSIKYHNHGLMLTGLQSNDD